MWRRVDGVEATIRPWRRQFDSCAGSGGQARRRREGVGCREERRQTKELHGPKLALGNACLVCLLQQRCRVRPCCKEQEGCDVVCAPRAAGEHEFRLRCDALVQSRLLLRVPCLQSIPGPRTARRASTGGGRRKCKMVGFGRRRPGVVRFARLR